MFAFGTERRDARESVAASRARHAHVLPHKEGHTRWQELNGDKVLSLNGSCSRSTAARVPEKDGEVDYDVAGDRPGRGRKGSKLPGIESRRCGKTTACSFEAFAALSQCLQRGASQWHTDVRTRTRKVVDVLAALIGPRASA